MGQGIADPIYWIGSASFAASTKLWAMLRSPRTLVCLAGLFGAAWFALAEDSESRYTLQAFQPENSFVVSPGETRVLRARILKGDGSGAPGVSVIFAAPTEGPSGTFAGADGPSGSFIRVETDVAGQAAVMLTTNQTEGVFEVGVAVEGLAAFNQFSFTNMIAAPAVAAQPQQIRDLVHEQRLSNSPLGPDVQLHGPVLAPAGSILKAPAPPNPVSRNQPIVVERDSWLMWIDEAPTGFFAHETQWILMDASLEASQAVAEAVVYPQRWYPVIVPPSLDAEWTAFFPAGSHPEAFNPDLLDAAAALFDEGDSIIRGGQGGQACIIAIHGPGLRGSSYDIRRYIDTFTAVGSVPASNVFTNGANDQVLAGTTNLGFEHVEADDIGRLVARAAAVPCRKVYFLMSTHGLDSNQRGTDASRTDANHPGGGVILADRGKDNPMSFDELANILKGLRPGAAPVDLCLFQNGCYTGQMREWIQGLGLDGSIVTPADADHMAWEDPNGLGSIYLTAYLAAKRNPAADTDGGGVSDQEAVAYVAATVNPSTQSWTTGDSVERIFAPNPSSYPVLADTFRRISADNLYLSGKGQRGSVCIRRPRSMPDDAQYEGRVLIINDGVAVNRLFDPDFEEEGVSAFRIPFTLAPGQDSVKVPVEAVGCGITRFEVAGRVQETSAEGERFVTYIGEGRIQVGHFTVVCPNGPTVEGPSGQPIQPQVDEITVEVNESKTVRLRFHGRDFDNTAPATRPDILAGRAAEINTISRDRQVATASPGTATKGGLEKEVDITITGHKVGMTGVGFILSPADQRIATKRRAAKEIKVNVIARVGSSSIPLIDPGGRRVSRVMGRVTDADDPENHIRVTGRMSSEFEAEVTVEGPDAKGPQQGAPVRSMRITMGPKPHFVDLEGQVSLADFSFTLAGAGPIPPFASVPARAEGRIPLPGETTGVAQSSNGITMTYTLGAGVFPGQPTVYEIELTTQDGGECEYELDVDPSPIPFSGAFRSAVLRTGQGCPWTATAGSDWLRIFGSKGTATGSGPAAFSLTALRNDTAAERTTTLTVQGAQASFTQQGTSAPGPVITGVSNGASFLNGVTGGSWITIAGQNLAATTRIWSDGDFNGAALPRSLDGVSVTVNGAPAYPYFISPGQLNVLTDEALAPNQSVDVAVTNPAGVSEAFRTVALPADPALFLFEAEGRRYAAAVHADGTYLGKPGLFGGLTTRAAAGGDVVQLYGAGFGPTEPPVEAGNLVAGPVVLARPVVVRIGGLEARVLFAGLVSSGLYQLNVVVPDRLAPGDHLVEVFVDGFPIQPGVHITVE